MNNIIETKANEFLTEFAVLNLSDIDLSEKCGFVMEKFNQYIVAFPMLDVRSDKCVFPGLDGPEVEDLGCEIINTILDRLDVQTIDISVLMGFLVTTRYSKEQLSSYNSFLHKIEEHVLKPNYDSKEIEKILVGLR